MVRFRKNGVEHMARIAASNQQDIGMFFWRKVAGQADGSGVADRVEEILSWPDEWVRHEKMKEGEKGRRSIYTSRT